jgi:UV excision repair protein RAD23
MRNQGEGFPGPDGRKGERSVPCDPIESNLILLPQPKPTPTPMPPAQVASTSTPTATPPAAAAAVEPAPSAPATEGAPMAVDPPAYTPAVPSAAAQPAFGQSTSFLSGEALQSTINNMVEMGFPRDQVLRALRVSYNNPDRAVEYLMSVGIAFLKYYVDPDRHSRESLLI